MQDWNIFVGEQHFENGLRWLERRVALKQAALHGFFTYSDLLASGDGALLAEALRALAASCALVALGYLASLLTLLTSTLVISQACLPQLQSLSAPATDPAPPALDYVAPLAVELSQLHLPPSVANYSLDPLVELLQAPDSDHLRCCTQWLKYHENTAKKAWSDSVVVYDWKTFEPWWSRTSVLNWLYQSSLVNPMQRWLEKINEYADLLKKALDAEPSQAVKCEDYDQEKDASEQKCVRQWLNLSKLSALVVSISDR